MTRRDFISYAGAIAAFRNDTLAIVEKLVSHTVPEAQDEAFWMQIREAFAFDPNIVNFNNGGCCPSPRIVQDAMRRQLELSNQAPSYYMWRQLEDRRAHV